MHMSFFRFFSNFRKSRLSRNLGVVFANRFKRLLRNFFSIVRNLFEKKYQNFVTFDRSFLNSKIRQISEKIHVYSDKLTNQFCLKKLGCQFFVDIFFKTNLLTTFWNC